MPHSQRSLEAVFSAVDGCTTWLTYPPSESSVRTRLAGSTDR